MTAELLLETGLRIRGRSGISVLRRPGCPAALTPARPPSSPVPSSLPSLLSSLPPGSRSAGSPSESCALQSERAQQTARLME